MAKAVAATRPASAVRALGGALLATLLLLGPGALPATAGAPENCCVCSSCPPPSAETVCFEGTSCEISCPQLGCAGAQSIPGFCSTQPGCPQFFAPAPAPAMAPYGLTVAAVVLAGFGLRGLRRRR